MRFICWGYFPELKHAVVVWLKQFGAANSFAAGIFSSFSMQIRPFQGISLLHQ